MEREQDAMLSRYMAEVQRHPRLSRDEERALGLRYRAKRDKRASDALISANLRHVTAIALKYRHYELPVSELIAEGNVGVVHALTKFDPNRGIRFITYAAYWIRAYILNYVIRSWSLVGGGSGAFKSKIFFRLRREKARLMSEIGDAELVECQLAERFNVDRPLLVDMLRRIETRDVSLSSSELDCTMGSLEQTLASPDVNQEELYEQFQREYRMSKIADAALAGLDRRERYVIEHRLMADSKERLTLAEIGRRLGISRERARQLESRALCKLRSRVVELSGWTSLDALCSDKAAE